MSKSRLFGVLAGRETGPNIISDSKGILAGCSLTFCCRLAPRVSAVGGAEQSKSISGHGLALVQQDVKDIYYAAGKEGKYISIILSISSISHQLNLSISVYPGTPPPLVLDILHEPHLKYSLHWHPQVCNLRPCILPDP